MKRFMTHARRACGGPTLPSVAALVAGLAALPACGKDAATTNAHGLRIEVAPLELTGIVDAEYELAVFNHDGLLVWRKTGLTSKTYGNGEGDLAYVGTCDASSNDNRVELTLVSLSDADGPLPASEWQNPTKDGPLVRSATCRENADSPVTFNLTVLRAAHQGFFDVAVEFEDIFCSAKLDCADAQGKDLELLFDPATGQRATTVVMGFACTTGNGTTTWLHLDDVHVECADDASYWFDPSLGPGNIPGAAPAFFAAGTYRGREQLPNVDKCYWNAAFGVREGAGARSCVLSGEGTATTGPLVAGRTDADTIYPYIQWAVPITDGNGQVMCGQQPLNGPASHVTTEYTPFSGLPFTHSLQCETQTIDSPPRALCAGNIVGVDDAVAVKWTAGGVSVAVGDQESPPYELGAGQEIGGCCLNPCCTTAPQPVP